MNEVFWFNSAKIIGRGHLLAGINCQDALKKGTIDVDGKTVYYGIVCDGCSEGADSEVGAKLAVAYLGRQIEILVKSKVSIRKIPTIVRKRLIRFLKKLLGQISFDSPRARIDFIKNNLLFTIIGFICAEETIVFAQGDGVVVIDDRLFVRDENDTPMYIGYEMVDRKYLFANVSPLPTEFDCLVMPTDDLSRLIIASDSLANELDIVSELWNNERPIVLQKKVNAWSFNDHKFKDDLSVIVLEKVF